MRLAFTSVLIAALFAGCGAKDSSSPLVTRFGTYPTPDPGRELVVTRRGKSLVDFKVVDKATGKPLIADSVGSDAMRWYLYWETPSRLWGYGSDIGYFKVFDFHRDGTVTETKVDAAMRIPEPVWSHLPSSLQSRYTAQSDGTAGRKN